MIKSFGISVKNTFKSLGYLFKSWVFKYLLISGLISVAVASIFFTLIYFFGDNLGDGLLNLVHLDGKSEWLTTGIEWLTRIFLWVGVLFIFKYVILIITGPVMSALSEKIEQKVTGKEFDKQSAKDQFRGMTRGIALNLSNIGRELFLTILLLLAGLIPGVAIVSGPLLLIVQAYYAGFGNMDLFMERRLNIKGSRAFMKKNKGLAIANGGVFIAILFIPVIGWFLAPTISTISGTLSGMELLDD